MKTTTRTAFVCLLLGGFLTSPPPLLSQSTLPWPIAKDFEIKPIGKVSATYDFRRENGRIPAPETFDESQEIFDAERPILFLDFHGQEVRLSTLADDLDLISLFRIYRITALDVVTKQASQGEEVEDLIRHVCREPLTDMADAKCDDHLGEEPITSLILFLNRPLPLDQRFLLAISKPPSSSDRATPGPASRPPAWIQEFSTIPETRLGRGPRTIGLDYFTLEANVPLDLQALKLFLVKKLRGEERCLPVQFVADYGQAVREGNIEGSTSLRLWLAGPLGLKTKPGRDFTFRLRGVSLLGQPPIAAPAAGVQASGCPAATSADPKDFTWKSTPVSEDDARYFAKLFGQAAEAESPVFSAAINLKPKEFSIGGNWLYQPTLVADIGSDNSKAKNSIQIMPVAFSWFGTRGEGDPLSANEFYLKGGLESDKKLDKKNWILDARYQPWFRNLYLSAEERRQQRNDPDIRFGRGFKPSLGIEVGRSVQANGGVVLNKAKAQEIVVPDHDIARVYLHLEGFVEVGRFTFKWESDLRHLLDDEFVAVLDSKTDTLSLRTVSGFHDIHSFSVDWNLDPSHHYVLDIEYQKGEAPPKYTELDVVKVAITIKF